MSDEFFRTSMGRQFYESTMPRIAMALERIAEKISSEKPEAPKFAVHLPMEQVERLTGLLRILHRRIHLEELAGHFPYWVIDQLEKVLNSDQPFIPADFSGREQPKLEDILGEHRRGIPGILFPVDNGGECDSEDGKVFIAREDASMMFRSDVDAANFVACLIHKPWKKYFDVPGKDYFHPYFEITLDEADRIHATYGSAPKKVHT